MLLERGIRMRLGPVGDGLVVLLKELLLAAASRVGLCLNRLILLDFLLDSVHRADRDHEAFRDRVHELGFGLCGEHVFGKRKDNTLTQIF